MRSDGFRIVLYRCHRSDHQRDDPVISDADSSRRPTPIRDGLRWSISRLRDRYERRRLVLGQELRGSGWCRRVFHDGDGAAAAAHSVSAGGRGRPSRSPRLTRGPVDPLLSFRATPRSVGGEESRSSRLRGPSTRMTAIPRLRSLTAASLGMTTGPAQEPVGPRRYLHCHAIPTAEMFSVSARA